MQRLRLASVPYLNALPLTWGLTRGAHRGRFDLLLAAPFECARRLRDATVDVALIPSIEFARAAGLAAVTGTGISSRHEVRSVMLLARREPAALRSLAVDLNSRTSVALAQLILGRRHGCRPPVVPMPPDLDAMLERHDAALLIGDAALRASLPGALETRGVRAIDLASEWNLMTGLPFVFAFWACRPVVSGRRMRAILQQSLTEGLAHVDAIASEESARTGLPADVISSYLRDNIHYRLGPREIDSLRVFFRMCREEGLLRAQAPGVVSASRSATVKSG